MSRFWSLSTLPKRSHGYGVWVYPWFGQTRWVYISIDTKRNTSETWGLNLCFLWVSVLQVGQIYCLICYRRLGRPGLQKSQEVRKPVFGSPENSGYSSEDDSSARTKRSGSKHRNKVYLQTWHLESNETSAWLSLMTIEGWLSLWQT
jgi:hypothetical protein